MATFTSLAAPARIDAVPREVGRTGGPTLWIRDPRSGELRRPDPASRVWAQDPVVGALVRVRSWKDVRDLDRESRRQGTPWERLVVVTDAVASPAEVRASLAGEGPWPAVHTDEESARGRRRLEVLGRPDPVDRVDPVEWVADLAADQKRLRRLGAGHVAHTLFGTKTRRDIVAGVGAAMLDRGPRGRLGNRHVVVALAAAASDLLSADEIADLLGWPAPDDRMSARSAGHLRTAMGLLPAGRRLAFLETVIVRSLGAQRSDAGVRWHGHDDEDWFRPDEWDPTGSDPRRPVDRYLTWIHDRILAAGAESLYVADDGTVRSTPDGSLASQLELAAFATEQYASQVGTLPGFTVDAAAYSHQLLNEVFPGIVRAWTWDETFLGALGEEVPGLPGSRILLPLDSRALFEWGDEMGNCIGDYGRVVDAGGVVGAVEVDGAVEVNFELRRSWTGGLQLGEVLSQLNSYVPHLVDPVEEHLRGVVARLPVGLVPATRRPLQVPEQSGPDAMGGATGPWTAVDRLEEATDERFVPRCHRTGGRRQRRRRHTPRPAPLDVLRRIASEPRISQIAAVAVRSMAPEVDAAFSFGCSSDRSIADVLRIAAAVSPADTWIVPGAGPLLGELLDDYDQLATEELAHRWDEIAPFAHSPGLDHAVRSVLIAILDGSLAESLVGTLDRDGESVARELFRDDRSIRVEWSYSRSVRRAFDEAWHRAGLPPRAERPQSLR